MSGGLAARAGLHTLGGTGVQMAIQLVSLAVLARLLEPKDFGVYAVAMTVIGVTALFRDLGLSTAAVQAKVLTTQTRTNLWWINTVVGAGLTLVTFLAGPLAARFFREPEVQTVLWVMAPTMLLAGATSQYSASLMRAMRYGVLAVIGMLSSVVGLVLSIALAWYGAGVWALCLPQLITAVGVLVASMVLCQWFPGLPRRGHGTRAMVKFGAAFFVTGLLTYVHRNLDAVLLGRLHGATIVGGFNRAAQMSRTPISTLSAPFARVALSIMAPAQDDPQALANLARKGQVLLSIPVLVAAGGLVAAAGPLVEMVLGAGWDQAVPFVRLIAASEALALMASVGGWLLTARGLGRFLIRLSVISTVTKITCVGFGTFWGPYGIVAGVTVSQLLLWPLSLYLSGRFSGVETGALRRNSFLLAAIGAAAAGAAWWVVAAADGRLHALWQVALAGVVLLAVHGLAMLLLPRYKADVTMALTAVKSGLVRKAGA